MTKKKAIIIGSAVAAVIAAAAAVFVLWNNDELGRKSISDINKELGELQFGEYSNLNFLCEPPRQELNKVYTITYEVPPAFINEEARQKAKESLVSKMDSLFDVKVNINEIQLDDQNGVEYDAISPSSYGEVWAGGTFMFTNERFNETLKRSCNITDASTYTDLSKPEDANKTVKIYGKEVNIKKAAEYAEQTIRNSLMDMFNDGEDIEFADAIAVIDENDDPNYLMLRFAHTIDGVRVNENGFIDNDPIIDNEIFYIRNPYIRVMMVGENEFAEIANPYYYDILEKNEIKEMIGLADAADILSQELAQNLKYDVIDVRLKYVAVSSNKNYWEPHTLTPMWSFVFKYKGKFQMLVSDSVAAYIDAVDGTVYYCDSSQQSLEISERK